MILKKIKVFSFLGILLHEVCTLPRKTVVKAGWAKENHHMRNENNTLYVITDKKCVKLAQLCTY